MRHTARYQKDWLKKRVGKKIRLPEWEAGNYFIPTGVRDVVAGMVRMDGVDCYLDGRKVPASFSLAYLHEWGFLVDKNWRSYPDEL